MEKLKRILTGLLIAAMFALPGCGGGGGGGGPSDLDGDGVPNAQDAFPNDAAKFSAFATKQLSPLSGGIFSAAIGINSAMKVIGMSDNGSQQIQGVLWSVAADGTQTDQVRLKPLGSNSYSAAYGINDSGIIVGESSKGSDTVAVWWPSGATASSEPTELLLLSATGPSAAYSINNRGVKVGEALDSNGRMVAVVWRSGDTAPVPLGGLASDATSAAFAVNESMKAVGESEVSAGGAVHAVIWSMDANGVLTDGPTDLGTLSGHLNSTALGVATLPNGKTVIVGESESATGEVHAVMWQEGLLFGYNIVDLGPAGARGSAAAISSLGLIAGFTDTTGSLATVWHAMHSTPVTTNPVFSDSSLGQALGINNAGYLVGISADRAFVAVPTP
ncbi:hypothetical protein [Geobacter sp. DSM 9736]|uniref:hypothetical protein n=1 Tax=Geobacter sp. DSM 9736 TaxID=1277350 RepID=UPI000B50912D|nr:hypothetical protein [Geobacter sp. DSM 9736]SNB44964.1 hypothetical protein SAMN06269301_0356 [Geobacter sp. DSM 9736]